MADKRSGTQFEHEEMNLGTVVGRSLGTIIERLRLFLPVVTSWSVALDKKHPRTRGHSERVSKYSLVIAEEMELPQKMIDSLKISAELHDIGKISVNEFILDKPGRRTNEEKESYRRHVQDGVDILKPVEQPVSILHGVAYHHENYDGSGYPERLKGDQIPLQARIIAVADELDTLSSDTCWGFGLDIEGAMEQTLELAGQRFHPEMVQVLKQAYDKGRIKRESDNDKLKEARRLLRLNDDSALSVLEKLAEEYPQETKIYCAIGDLLSKKRESAADAIKFYDKAINLNPSLPYIHYAKATALLKARKFRRAISSYEDAIMLCPTYMEAFEGKAEALMELSSYFEAALCFRTIAKPVNLS